LVTSGTSRWVQTAQIKREKHMEMPAVTFHFILCHLNAGQYCDFHSPAGAPALFASKHSADPDPIFGASGTNR
jgi:hypothetical protein